MNKFENTNNFTVNDIENIQIDLYNPKFNIAILDCGVIKQCQRQRAFKIQKILKSHNVKSEIISMLENNNLKQEINNDNLSNYSHIIITGSKLDYDSELIEIKYLKELIKQINSKNIPTLGICFGAQLIASVFGGEVEKNQNKEIGFNEISILENHELFNNIKKNENNENKLNVFQYHFDHIAQLPNNSKSLATSNKCHQAYIYENFFGIQFHPEIDLEFAKCEYSAVKDCPITNCCENDFFKNHNKNHKPELILENFLKFEF